MPTISARLVAPLALATVWTVSAITQPADDLGPLLGTWRITGVTVAPSPVQAVTRDDPSLMGALLDVTRDRLSWRAPHRSTSLDMSCEQPRLVRGAILCRSGSFGPPGTRATRRGDTLTLPWYDGATLRLTRAPLRRNEPALTANGYGAIRIGGSARAPGYRFAATGPTAGGRCRSLFDPAVPGLEVIAERGVVTVVKARGFPVVSHVRTDRGIGVRSTEAELRMAYAPLAETPHKYEDAPAKNLVWRAPGTRNGLRFEIDTKRRVSAIHAGAEPALMYVEGCL